MADTDRSERLEALFLAALARPDRDRPAFLESACDDLLLREQVADLLQQADRPGDEGHETPTRAHLATGSWSGRHVGRYVISSLIGSGGMGDVYRARDTSLDRDVAIKVLPEGFAQDPERLARFDREARVLAHLNHPNIGAIYGIERSDDRQLLVLELVEGDTLSARLDRGPMPADRALMVAAQIAHAIEAAHSQGVIHRDLKPDNIKITSDGHIKVLDFGIARTFSLEYAHMHPAADQTTLTLAASGTIVGTVPYMSPEQARGQRVDKRTDIWAFGCVLYELLAGHRAFDAETASDTLVRVLEKEPNWDRLPPTTPSQVIFLLKRCLQKDQMSRLHDIADARLLIEDAMREPSTAWSPLQARSRPVLIWWTLAVASLVGLALWVFRPEAAATVDVQRFVVPVADRLRGNEAMAFSPDGTQLVYAVQEGTPPVSQLHLRPLDQFESTAMAGTSTGSRPFFSYDGRWVGFFAADGLKKVPAAGGRVVFISAAPAQWGGAWMADNSIVFGSDEGLMRVSAEGGTPAVLAAVDAARGENSYRWPDALPDGSIVFTVWKGPGRSDVALLRPGGQVQTIVQQGGKARYVAPRFLLFGRGEALHLVAFDPSSGSVSGAPVPILNNVRSDLNAGYAFVVSRSGSLAYCSGELQLPDERTLATFDAQGREVPMAFPLRRYVAARFSPDSARVAVTIRDRMGDQIDTNVWVGDAATGNLTRLTFAGSTTGDLVWTPDGLRITYRKEGGGLFWRRADLTTPEEQLGPVEEIPVSQNVGDWSPDGKTLLLDGRNPKGRTGVDLWTLSADQDSRPSGYKVHPFLQTASDEMEPVFSADGLAVAYVANHSGRNEVYVRPFSDVGDGRPVSHDGGVRPHWRTGDLFFEQETPNRIVRVAPGVGTALVAGPARSVLDVRGGLSYTTMLPNGRPVFLKVPAAAKPASPRIQINVVVNWVDELRRQLGK